MTWSDIFTAAAFSAIFSTVASGVLQTFFTERFKASVKTQYDIQVERAKDEMKHKSDLELERFKNGLVAQAALKQISFQSLQDKRAVIIAEVYQNAREAMRSLAEYTAAFELSGGPTREERRSIAFEKGRQFTSHFRLNRIYFPKAVADDLEKVCSHIIEHFNRFYISIDASANPRAKEWNDIFTKVKSELEGADGLLAKIEAHFRTLLGDA